MPASKKRRTLVFIIVVGIASLAVFLIPSPSRSPYKPGSSERVAARIIEVDNSVIKQIGPIKEGDQQLRIRVLTGRFAGREYDSANHLMGKLEFDKLFAPGDRALAVLDLSPDRKEVAYANVIDHFRLDILALIALVFFAFLLFFGGSVGLRAMLSFVFTLAVIFKVLLPAMLLGWPPIPTTLAIVAILVAVILFLVGGLNRKSLAAYLGSMGGILITALLAGLVARALKINGAALPFAESLLYMGYGNLKLQDLFISGIFLASSGAILDVGMDIAAAMDEIVVHNPAVTRLALLRSGISIGRLVIGTQVTTLLLAYSSSYSGLLMTFMAQGIPTANVLNLAYIASEFAHTLVGSFGLVLAAPLTAIVGSLLLAQKPVHGLAKHEAVGAVHPRAN